ncbi:MAG: ABC transporter permease [Rectinemataceae bacterium]|jgi:ribose transport system permease protein
MKQKKAIITSNSNTLGITLAFMALCAILAVLSKNFLKPTNLLNILQQVSINFTIAIGMTFIILLGSIDLSVGSNVAFTGLVMAIMMKTLLMPVWIALLTGLVVAMLIGLFNGFLVTYFDVPPFIATLGTMSIARGAAYTITAGQPIYTFPHQFLVISERVGGIPLFAILIMLVLFVLGWYVLKYTRLGRYTYAIGGNENSSKLSGINVKAVKSTAFAIIGLCCGVASILLTSRLDSAVPTNGDGYELDAIAAVVIGGTSMSGGEGSLLGTLIGVLIIGVIGNGLNLLSVPQGAQRMVKGMIIVIAVIIDVMRRRSVANAK